ILQEEGDDAIGAGDLDGAQAGAVGGAQGFQMGSNDGDPNNPFPWSGNLRIRGDGLSETVSTLSSPVPEPSTMLLGAVGLGLLLLRRAQR
ncbi:MAG: hypothetical protein B7X34_01875, partial [Acidobacteriia bacterium 12-62-4]